MNPEVAILLALSVPVCWCFVVYMTARTSGWAALAGKYRATNTPAGKRFDFQSIKLGSVNYSAGLTIVVSSVGLYLSMLPFFRIGHPPLFIPWADIHDVQERKVLWHWRFVEMQIGTPAITTLTLPLYLIEHRPMDQ